jgi:hypothetical protein
LREEKESNFAKVLLVFISNKEYRRSRKKMNATLFSNNNEVASSETSEIATRGPRVVENVALFFVALT